MYTIIVKEGRYKGTPYTGENKEQALKEYEHQTAYYAKRMAELTKKLNVTITMLVDNCFHKSITIISKI